MHRRHRGRRSPSRAQNRDLNSNLDFEGKKACSALARLQWSASKPAKPLSRTKSRFEFEPRFRGEKACSALARLQCTVGSQPAKPLLARKIEIRIQTEFKPRTSPSALRRQAMVARRMERRAVVCLADEELRFEFKPRISNGTGLSADGPGWAPRGRRIEVRIQTCFLGHEGRAWKATPMKRRAAHGEPHCNPRNLARTEHPLF